jgi:hypothetical protein
MGCHGAHSSVPTAPDQGPGLGSGRLQRCPSSCACGRSACRSRYCFRPSSTSIWTSSWALAPACCMIRRSHRRQGSRDPIQRDLSTVEAEVLGWGAIGWMHRGQQRWRGHRSGSDQRRRKTGLAGRPDIYIGRKTLHLHII